MLSWLFLKSECAKTKLYFGQGLCGQRHSFILPPLLGHISSLITVILFVCWDGWTDER